MPPRAYSPQEIALAQSNLAKAKALMRAAAENLLDFGDVLNTLAHRDLYAAIPGKEYLSFRHFLRKEGLIPYSTARKYMVLAKEYPGPNARKQGVDKLLALLRIAPFENQSASDLVENDAVVGDRPVSEHTVDSLEALKLANEERKEQQEALKLELQNNPVLAEQHKESRSTARKLEALMEKDFAGPDAEVKAVRQEGRHELRIRIELALEDAKELLELLKDHQEP